MKRGKGKITDQFHRLADNGPLPDHPFIALVDGADAPLLPLDLPAGLRGQAREQVARLQISDGIGLALDKTEIRPFAAKPHATPWSFVIITATDKVTTWRKHIAKAGKNCRAILPDYLSLPVIPGVWTIATTKTRTTARLGLNDGFTCEPDLALALLSKAAKPKAVFRLGTDAPELDSLLAALDVPVCNTNSELAKQNLPAPKVLGHGEMLFDLSQNPMVILDHMRALFRAWRMPVILSLLALGFWTASTLFTLRTDQAQALTERRATADLVRQVFVPSGPILDIRAQVSRALSERKNQTADTTVKLNPLALLKNAAIVMDAQNAHLLNAGFTSNNGLSVTLRMGDFAGLDQLVSALQAQNIAAQIQESSAAESGGVNGILLLTSIPEGQP